MLDALNQKALFRVCRDYCGAAWLSASPERWPAAKGAVPSVEAEPGLPRSFVRSVTLKTIVREDGSDVALKVDGGR